MIKVFYFGIVFVLSSVLLLSVECPVELILKSDRAEYEVGECIIVSLIIVKKTKNDILEYNYMLLTGRQFYKNFHIFNSNGEKIRMLSDFDYGKIKDWVILTGETTLVDNVVLTDIYSEPYYIPQPHTLTNPDRYEVRYVSRMEIRDVSKTNIIWDGSITSTPLFIVVKELSEDRYKEVFDCLAKDDNSTNLVQLLTKIGYKDKVTFFEMEVLRDIFFRSGMDVRMKILRVLNNKRDEAVLSFIKDVLREERDSMVRGGAISNLKNFDISLVEELLINECREGRYESYRTAVVVLGDIGSTNSVGVLQHVADTDSKEWVRKRALESIEKIRRRNSDK